MTAQDANRLVAVAVAAYPSMQDRDLAMTARVWERALADLPLAVVERAVLKLIMTRKFFPAVAEIREAAESLLDNGHPTPEEAWGEVMKQLNPYRAPQYSDPLIHRAVRAVGYLSICMSERLGVERAHFLQIYQAYLNRAVDTATNESIEKIAGPAKQLLLQVVSRMGGNQP